MKRYKLRKWMQSEEIRSKIFECAKNGDANGASQAIMQYIEMGDTKKNVDTWYDAFSVFSDLYSVNTPKLLPILMQDDIQRDEPWNYDGRVWYVWSDMLASNYSYSQEYIAEMDVDDAIALIQEISIREQLRLEWQWSLSEIAYPYNETTQKSEYKPLPRPEWMKIITKRTTSEPKKVMIRKDMLPVGNVIHAQT